jgi:hypothetical protein
MIDSMIAPVVADEGFGTERLFQDDFPILGKWFRRCGRIVSSEPGRGYRGQGALAIRDLGQRKTRRLGRADRKYQLRGNAACLTRVNEAVGSLVSIRGAQLATMGWAQGATDAKT